MPPFSKSKIELVGHAGLTIDGKKADVMHEALHAAREYRGDISITRLSNGVTVEGFLFDLRQEAGGEFVARVMHSDRQGSETVRQSDIGQLQFTGRDTASGKSFDTWMKKYVQSRLAGKRAAIESESLERE